MDAKVSSPPMTYQSVGGSIVVGARESRGPGEGGQLVGISEQNSRMLTGMKFPLTVRSNLEQFRTLW